MFTFVQALIGWVIHCEQIRVSDFRPEWVLIFADDDEGLCEMCERETVLTFHHLVCKCSCAPTVSDLVSLYINLLAILSRVQ
jgi:hypothetical protein